MVALHFGVGLLAHHDDGDIRARRAGTRSAVGDLGVLACGRADRFENRRASWCDGAAFALPIDGPTTALHAEVVRAAAGHMDTLRRARERQHATLVLEQDE